MELHDNFEEIESPDFRARYMIFSGFKLVRNALSREKAIASLINEARLNPSYIDNIGKRILFLSAENKDRPGASFDVAIAAYLYCLYQTDQYFAKRMSEYVLQMGKLWWSVDLALFIKKNMELFADSGNWQFEFYGHPTPIHNLNWRLRGQPETLNDTVQFTINGAEQCNISGQLYVNSPQKTRSPAPSVSLTY
ncbi:MAG: hypothetical protein OXG85_02800 [Chloroflexi bacterium]|nr:hypothetical protein [Chloroflexota bacterium]